MHAPQLPSHRSARICSLNLNLGPRFAALLLVVSAAGTAVAAQEPATGPQSPSTASVVEAKPTPAAPGAPGTKPAEPKTEALSLSLPNGRQLMSLGEGGPERLIQILKLLGGLALASIACAVMATWLAPRRAPREAFAYPEPTPTALRANPYPGAPTAPRRGEVVATGQPWQGRSAPTASPYQPVRQDQREVAEA